MIHKFFTPIMSAVMVCLLLTDCTNQPKQGDTAVNMNSLVANQDSASFKMKSKVFKQVVTLLKGKKVPSIEFDIQFLYADDDKKRSEVINKILINKIFGFDNIQPEAAVDSFIHSTINNTSTELLELCKEIEDEELEDMFKYSYTIDCSEDTANCSPTIMNYIVATSNYEGGAHPESYTSCYNFDKEDGHLVELKELMNKGFETPLKEILFNKLKSDFKCKNEEEMSEQGILTSKKDMIIAKNFLLKKDGIEFVYSPYEIGAYALGCITLKLTFDEMKSLLKTNS